MREGCHICTRWTPETGCSHYDPLVTHHLYTKNGRIILRGSEKECEDYKKVAEENKHLAKFMPYAIKPNPFLQRPSDST